MNLTDAIFILDFLFQNGRTPSCMDAADCDDNGEIEITDAIAILQFLFMGGSMPAAPGPVECGRDPDLDELSCAEYDAC